MDEVNPVKDGAPWNKGQMAVELALVLPLLALLVAGVIHFGSMAHCQQVITNAARVGARLGCQPGISDGQVYEAVIQYCEQAGLDPNKSTTFITLGSPTSDSIVTVQYQFSTPIRSLFVAMAGLITGNPPSPGSYLTAQCTMKY